MKLQQSIEIARPTHEVFAFVTDHARMPEWISTLESSTPNGPGPQAKGFQFSQEHLERGKRIRFDGKVTEYAAASKLTLELRNDDATVTLSYAFEEHELGTRLEQITEVKLKSMMLRMVAGAFEAPAKERMAKDFETLKMRLEG